MSLKDIVKPLDSTYQRGDDPLLLANNSCVYIVSGRRGAGKSTLVLNLLNSKKAWRGRYDNIFLISPTAKTDTKFKRLVDELEPDGKYFDALNQDNIEAIFKQVQADNDEGRNRKKQYKPLHLLLLDDVVVDLPKSRTSLLDRIVIQSRHHNITLVVITQKYNLVNRTLRANADLISFFPSLNRKEVQSLQEDLNISPELFERLYQRAAAGGPNSFLHCNLLAYPPRFYAGFEPMSINLQTGLDE